MPSTLRSHGYAGSSRAYTVNRLGTWFGFVALSLAVFDHTHSALAVAALLLAGQALPAFVVPALIAARRSIATPQRAERAVPVRGRRDGRCWRCCCGTSGCPRSCSWRRSTAPRRWPRARCCAPRPRGRHANRPSRARDAARPARISAAFSAGGRAAGRTRPSTSPSRPRSCSGPALAGVLVAAAGAPAALFIDAGSFLICGGCCSTCTPHVEEAGDDSVRERACARRGRTSTRCPCCARCCLRRRSRSSSSTPPARSRSPMPKVTLHAGDRGYGLLLGTVGSRRRDRELRLRALVRRALGTMLTAGTLAMGLAYIGFAAAPRWRSPASPRSSAGSATGSSGPR